MGWQMEKDTYAAGTYRVLRALGEGGNARVYLVIHERTCRLLALKVIPFSGIWADGEREYVCHMNHPGLPKIYDLFQEDGCLCLAMDYIAGTNLKEWKTNQGRPGEKEAVQWLSQLADILNYLHSRVPPLIHGDIKPSNVMLGTDGKVFLVDFGSCLVSGRKAEKRFGTHGYASPEQEKGWPTEDFRSDFYSLGKTFQFLMENDGSRAFQKILKKCVEPDRERRYSQDQELIRAVRRLQRRGKFFTLGLSLAAMGLLAGGSLWQYRILQSNQIIQYETLLESNQVSKLEWAIQLFPGREDAYQKLLQMDLMDQIFSAEESQKMEILLQEYGEAFSKKEEVYASFCYEMGLAYWFYYQGQEGKSYGRLWFGKASRGLLPKEKQKRAAAYENLGAYYEKKAKREITGEGEFSWEGYLNAMEDMCQLDGVNEEQAEQKRSLKEELLSQLYDSLPKFRQEGIIKAKIQRVLEKIQALDPFSLENQVQLTWESLELLYGEDAE